MLRSGFPPLQWYCGCSYYLLYVFSASPVKGGNQRQHAPQQPTPAINQGEMTAEIPLSLFVTAALKFLHVTNTPPQTMPGS